MSIFGGSYSGPPKWVKQAGKTGLLPLFNDIVSRYQPKGTSLTAGARNLLASQMGPDAQNPYLTSLIDSIKTNAMDTFGRQLGQTRGGIAANWGTGGLGSSKARLAENDLTHSVNQDVNNRVSELLANNFNTKLSLIPTALSMDDRPFDQALKLFSTMSGGTSSTTTDPNLSSLIGQGAGAGLGILAAI